MRESVTQAVILSLVPVKEKDMNVSLFTKEHGRVNARVIGGKKPLSKFAPHLDPLTLVIARLVEKNTITLTDVLEENRFKILREESKRFSEAIKIIALIDVLLPLEVPEGPLWNEVVHSFEKGEPRVANILKILGYDSERMICGICKNPNVGVFSRDHHLFVCESCGGKFSFRDVVYIT